MDVITGIGDNNIFHPPNDIFFDIAVVLQKKWLACYEARSTSIYALTLISIRNRRGRRPSILAGWAPSEDETIWWIPEKEIDIVICLVKIACPGVCTYYHTITTRQRMIYGATTGQSTRKIMCFMGVRRRSVFFCGTSSIMSISSIVFLSLSVLNTVLVIHYYINYFRLEIGN